jgi:hypothetical protein
MLLKTGRLILTVIGFAVFLGLIELHQSGCREKRKVAAPRPKETEVSAIVHGTTFREGIFEVNLPSSFTRVPPAELGEIRRAMVGGGRELAEASKSGEARYISENTITFLSAFQTEGGRLALAIAGIQSPAA